MRQRLYPLTNLYFVSLLVILLANDFYFKYEYHNWITGKLSDFAGIFVFVYFWTTLFPRQKNVVCILTGFLFILWKSPYSQPFINFFNENFYSIDRTVDMSDLLALLVLPISCSDSEAKYRKPDVLPIPIAVLTIFSFCATSMPAPTQTFDRPEYVLFRPAEFEYIAVQPNEFKVYDLDSIRIVAVSQIEIAMRPTRSDDYFKSQILADLDLRVLSAATGGYDRGVDLDSYRSLRDALTVSGPTSIKLNLDSITDELEFVGTRLHGRFRRYAKEGEPLIEGRYKKGIQDSTWNFYRNDRIATRQHFTGGEMTMIEESKDGDVVTIDVRTRRDTIAKQYVMLTAYGVLILLIATRLFLNFRASDEGTIVKISTLEKVIEIILLPTIIFAIAKVTSSFISESENGVFVFVGQFVLTNAVLMPFFIALHYVISLRSKYDLILYILLFIFGLMWIDDYLYLKHILV